MSSLLPRPCTKRLPLKRAFSINSLKIVPITRISTTSASMTVTGALMTNSLLRMVASVKARSLLTTMKSMLNTRKLSLELICFKKKPAVVKIPRKDVTSSPVTFSLFASLRQICMLLSPDLRATGFGISLRTVAAAALIILLSGNSKEHLNQVTSVGRTCTLVHGIAGASSSRVTSLLLPSLPPLSVPSLLLRTGKRKRPRDKSRSTRPCLQPKENRKLPVLPTLTKPLPWPTLTELPSWSV